MSPIKGGSVKKYLVIMTFALVLFGGTFYWQQLSHKNSELPPKKDEIRLPIQTLKNTSFTYVKSYIGTVQAIQSVNIVPYLSGFLKEVLVQSGQEVKKGETLFMLDQRIPLADLNQAKEASQQAKATRENALTFYERMKNTQEKAISPTELEQAKAKFQEADAAYQRALAAQNQAQTLYDYTTILAPISGWVGNITATIGEYLSPEGKVLATIIGFSPIRLTFSVPLASYHTELPFTSATLQIVLANGKTVNFENFKVLNDNQADKSTDSMTFFVDVPNDEKEFIPGAYIEIRFLFQQNGILVDKNWLTLNPDGAQAYILNNQIIEKRKVQIKGSVKNQYWIEGLNEGQEIITVAVSPYQIGQKAEGVKP
ncbi:MAG: efflux RND transporter periplasmic adaptor subunit [Alphaproteobacteria bacterium]|nr:efflux RND transporter periplasmic adaptor subunit [Alphaproteobacteria bacterium]